VFVARAAARGFIRISVPPERVLVVGGGAMAQLLAQKIRSHPEYGLDPIGFVDSHEPEASDTGFAVPYLGTLDRLPAVALEQRIERLVIAAPAVDAANLADVVRSAKDLSVKVSILPHIMDVIGPSAEIDDVEGITILGLNPAALTPSSRFLKRAMDVTIALPVLILCLPAMLVVAAVVKATSAGPVFFSQQRVGREGRTFRMHKFRTMVADADERVEELKRFSAHPAWLLLSHDPRITPIGNFLRRTSIDELPQLWNVLRGDMSLVGPRPMPLEIDEKISGWGRRRLDLTPGITGLWQVLGRTNIPFEEMVKLDYLYVTNWSLWHDVRLLIRTFPAVVRRRGVN
jgi:exopolysaccharide biosynthesis polyprenyl glycosylphosphotransferase